MTTSTDFGFSFAPISIVQKIDPDGACADFGHHRRHALELVALDQLDNPPDDPLVKPKCHYVLGAAALVDQVIEDRVRLVISKPKFPLIRLPLPQAGRRGFLQETSSLFPRMRH